MHIVLIQGTGIGASEGLIGELRAHLQDGESLDAPPMPEADDPQASRWLPAIGALLAAQEKTFVAIGHSLGASSLLQWLAGNPPPANLLAVIGVATPFWGDRGWSASEFALPPGAQEGLLRIPNILLLRGDADGTVPLSHADRIQQAVPHVLVETVPGMDHEWTGGGALLLERARRFG